MAIRIRCFPSSDRDFFDHVHALTAELSSAQAQSTAAVEHVLGQVRDRYPQCRISIREGLAILTTDEPVWYAYRDGAPVAPKPGSVAVRTRSALSSVIARLARHPSSPVGVPEAAAPAAPRDLPPVAPVEAATVSEPALVAAAEPEVVAESA